MAIPVRHAVARLAAVVLITAACTQSHRSAPDGGPDAHGQDIGVSDSVRPDLAVRPYDCAGVPPVALGQIWREYLDDAPTSGRGGCVRAGCHLDGKGGLRFTTPAEFIAATVNVRSQLFPEWPRINPGDPNTSYLYFRLTPEALGSRMPESGPYLTDSDLALIAGWICAGAAP